jgi:cyclophilin family peptidyl-prolyl cis-trans isomerase
MFTCLLGFRRNCPPHTNRFLKIVHLKSYNLSLFSRILKVFCASAHKISGHNICFRVFEKKGNQQMKILK